MVIGSTPGNLPEDEPRQKDALRNYVKWKVQTFGKWADVTT